jgi:diphosphomevalonate decarboxylase
LKATAVAHPNIALVKYWGKRNERLVLPHQSSVSVTLGPLAVVTTVEFDDRGGDDIVELNRRVATGTERSRVIEVLSRVRTAARRELGAKVGAARMVSRGDFPAAAGLASSAAAFAALAVAARTAVGFERSKKRESIEARRGSGSACRSIEGGFVRWNRGTREDGLDSFGVQLFDESHWPDLRLLVGMVSREEKDVKSRDGMRNAVKTSPYYEAWTRDAEREAKAIVAHLQRRDLEAVGEIAERNAWRMHATSLSANPPLCYLKPRTLELMSACALARRSGLGVWFTLDAGPNPVVLTSASEVRRATSLLKRCGAQDVVCCAPGGEAAVVEKHLF